MNWISNWSWMVDHFGVSQIFLNMPHFFKHLAGFTLMTHIHLWRACKYYFSKKCDEKGEMHIFLCAQSQSVHISIFNHYSNGNGSVPKILYERICPHEAICLPRYLKIPCIINNQINSYCVKFLWYQELSRSRLLVSPLAQLMTPTETLILVDIISQGKGYQSSQRFETFIILDITKIEFNKCFIIHFQFRQFSTVMQLAGYW